MIPRFFGRNVNGKRDVVRYRRNVGRSVRNVSYVLRETHARNVAFISPLAEWICWTFGHFVFTFLSRYTFFFNVETILVRAMILYRNIGAGDPRFTIFIRNFFIYLFNLIEERTNNQKHC